MTFSNFRTTVVVGVFSALVGSVLLPTAARAQAPIQAPLGGGPNPTSPTAPLTGVPLASTKKTSFTDEEIKAMGQGPAFPYSLLDEAIQGIVTDKGDVNYNKLQGNDALAVFVRAVGLADLSQFPVFTDKDVDGKPVKNRDSELTFWINAYNGLFLQTLTKPYPFKSVTQIKDLDTAKHLVAGKEYSFAELRKIIAGFDARALFALVDGTRFGPKTPQIAYRFSHLDDQLEATVKAYVNDTTRVTSPDRISNSVQISTWMQGVDPYFKAMPGRKKWGGIRSVLAGYTDKSADQRYLTAGDYEVKFFPPSTELNDTVTSGTVLPAS